VDDHREARDLNPKLREVSFFHLHVLGWAESFCVFEEMA
jgi:hypothetical protein